VSARAGQLGITLDLRRLTEGVECRKDSSVLDEIPGACKDIDAVTADRVDVVHTLKQVMLRERMRRTDYFSASFHQPPPSAWNNAAESA